MSKPNGRVYRVKVETGPPVAINTQQGPRMIRYAEVYEWHTSREWEEAAGELRRAICNDLAIPLQGPKGELVLIRPEPDLRVTLISQGRWDDAMREADEARRLAKAAAKAAQEPSPILVPTPGPVRL